MTYELPLTVEIRRFRRDDQAAVQRLVLEGLEEHWGVIDPGLNTDLDDFEASFAGGTVLVACESHRIVGVGVLVPLAPGRGEVKRMSVARRARRRGIGAALLRELVADAERRGWHDLSLETSADWDAVQFYGAVGFELTHHEDGAFGRDAYFRFDLRRE